VEPLRDPAAEAGLTPTAGQAERADGAPSLRASNAERDAAVTRLQDAFAEGRLDDTVFDTRMRAALIATTHADLDTLLADLPPAPAGAAPVTGPDPTRAGRYAIAWKGSVRRAGRWRVPDRYTTVVYKGGGTLDLRAAELLSPVTTIVAVAYKSTISLLVPPGVRVEMTGFGVTQGQTDDLPLAPDAPVLHIRGITYKGSVETSSRPAGAAGPADASDAADAAGAAGRPQLS